MNSTKCGESEKNWGSGENVKTLLQIDIFCFPCTRGHWGVMAIYHQTSTDHIKASESSHKCPCAVTINLCQHILSPDWPEKCVSFVKTQIHTSNLSQITDLRNGIVL